MKNNDLEDFLLNRGLYSNWTIDESLLNKLMNNLIQFDSYCPNCDKERVFTSINNKVSGGGEFKSGANKLSPPNNKTKQKIKTDLDKTNGIFAREFICPKKHNIIFIFKTKLNEDEKFIISKIGQSPSLRDLNELNIKNYSKILPNEKYIELSTAIGLYSHGVGIGSLIYLRRVFEYLIEEAYDKAKSEDSNFNESDFKNKRVKDKISLLKNYLPEYMVENKHIYSIMSEGIHNLKEEKCKKIFNPIKTGLLLILEERLRKKEKEKLINMNSEELNKLNSDLYN
ncbi:MAG: hypothetical protein ACOCUI_04445 [bacterium]